MSTQSILHKTVANYIDTSDLIYKKMAEDFIIKDEYLPHTKGYCYDDFYHLKNLTRLLQSDKCEIIEFKDKIIHTLNTLQLKYNKLNQFK